MLKQDVGKQDDVDAAEAEKRVQTIALHISEEELRLAARERSPSASTTPPTTS